MNKKKGLIVIIIFSFLIGLFIYFDNSLVKSTQEFENELRELIVEWNSNPNHYADFTAESHCIFKIKENENEKIIYGRFCIIEYTFSEDDKRLHESGGYNDLLVVYLDKKNGKITNVWTPQDGDNYVSSVLSKFPFVTWSRALIRSERYTEAMLEECNKQILEYQSKNK